MGDTDATTATVRAIEPRTLSLTVTAEKRRGVNRALLQWSPATTVDVWPALDGGQPVLIAGSVDGSEYRDAHGRRRDATRSWV